MHDNATSGWLPAALNRGWTYRDRVRPIEAGLTASAFYALRHSHSSEGVWRQRLAAGEIARNGAWLGPDQPLAAGDALAWRRPPWWEGAVPATWTVLHDDGDLHVIDKPAGLPVLPAGGWLEHTVLRLLEQRHRADPAGTPRPVHRLGRFTSGLLVCARRPETRAWLSARLRQSTADGEGCHKIYRALLVPGALALAPGQSLTITTAIGRRAHPRLGRIWCAADGHQPGDLPARSQLTLLGAGGDRRDPGDPLAPGDRVEVAIATGRPHQIRIHCAAVGAPLLGDPLYGPGGQAREEALPGEGGYRLRAWRLELERPGGGRLGLEAPPAPWDR